MNSLEITTLILIIPFLILIEGFFSGAEIALLSADKLALKAKAKSKDKGALLALELANRPERVLSTTLLMTSLCVIGSSSLISLYFLTHDASYSDLKAVAVTSPLVVLFGELIPKTVFQRNATRFAPWVAYPIYWAFWLMFPITRVLSSYTNRLSRIASPIEELITGKRRTTREDIQALLTYSRKETEIKSSEKRMIRRIFEFRFSEAKHALIPLVRVDAIDESSSVQEALARFENHRHSRMPVYSERIDNIVGILEAADLLSVGELEHPVRLYTTPAHYVAETQPLADLILQMRKQDTEMAIVVDEHGGAVGILTFEDIVEEVVGEISDEYDYETNLFKELSDRSWIIQAKMEISQINEILKFDLPEGDYKTLSGFLLQQFGRIPEAQDELFFNTSSGSYKFTIQKATDRHIETVLIQQLE